MAKSEMVFLSSTVDDMQEERNAATDVLNFLHQKVSRCEFFPARADSPEEVCLNEAENCGIFIGIYKNRYGFISKDNNPDMLSVTELEYNKAKQSSKPILLFYHTDDSQRDEKLEGFLEKIKSFSKGHYVKKFSNVGELKYLILQAIVSELSNHPQYTKEELNVFHDLIPDLRNYQRILLNQLEYADPKGIARPTVLLQHRIRDLFVPPELKKEDSEEERNDGDFLYHKSIRMPKFDSSWDDIEKLTQKKESDDLITTGINILDKIGEKKPLVILGSPGSGKSTMLKYLCSDIILNSSIIPFYIQIRALSTELESGSVHSVLEYLSKKFSDIKINEDFFNKQLKSGSCLVVFDGLDEVWSPKQRLKINEIIQQFCSVWSNQNKIIISSRLTGYLQNPLTGNFELLKIELFTKKKIREFIMKWARLVSENSDGKSNDIEADQSASKLIAILVEDAYLQKIASSPIILNILCLTFMRNASFPKRKHLLYIVLIETLLSSWEERKGIEKRKLDWTEYLKILRKIAFSMFDNEKSQINQFDLYELIKSHLKEEGISEIESDSVRDIIINLEERSGIIINDGSGNYFFYHLSFLEYFVALELSTKKEVEDIFKYFTRNLFDSRNFEIFSFISSLLSDKGRPDSSKFLNYILETKLVYQEVHIMNLLIVLQSLVSGATITNDFKTKVFDIIEKTWDCRRKYDRRFFMHLSGLIYSPLENDIVELWRKKCLLEPEFYRCDITDFIIDDPKYVEDLIRFCDTDLNNDKIQLYSITRITTIIQNSPSKRLLEYILQHTKLQEFLRDDILFGMANAIKGDQTLTDLYFKKIEDLSTNENDHYMLLKYSALIDKKRAEKYLLQLPENEFNTDMKTQFLGKRESDPVKIFESLLDAFLNVKENEELFEDISVNLSFMTYSMPDEYQNEILELMLNRLAKLSVTQRFHGHMICGIIERYSEDNERAKEFFKQRILQIETNFKDWRLFLLGMICQLGKSTEEDRKILLSTLSDEKEEIKVRSHCLDTLVKYYQNDRELATLIPKILGNHTLQTYCLDFLIKNPEDLKKNIKEIVDCYYKGPLEDYYILPVDVVREYIKLTQ